MKPHSHRSNGSFLDFCKNSCLTTARAPGTGALWVPSSSDYSVIPSGFSSTLSALQKRPTERSTPLVAQLQELTQGKKQLRGDKFLLPTEKFEK